MELRTSRSKALGVNRLSLQTEAGAGQWRVTCRKVKRAYMRSDPSRPISCTTAHPATKEIAAAIVTRPQ